MAKTIPFVERVTRVLPSEPDAQALRTIMGITSAPALAPSMEVVDHPRAMHAGYPACFLRRLSASGNEEPLNGTLPSKRSKNQRVMVRCAHTGRKNCSSS